MKEDAQFFQERRCCSTSDCAMSKKIGSSGGLRYGLSTSLAIMLGECFTNAIG
jgi:hypothetical protein